MPSSARWTSKAAWVRCWSVGAAYRTAPSWAPDGTRVRVPRSPRDQRASRSQHAARRAVPSVGLLGARTSVVVTRRLDHRVRGRPRWRRRGCSVSHLKAGHPARSPPISPSWVRRHGLPTGDQRRGDRWRRVRPGASRSSMPLPARSQRTIDLPGMRLGGIGGLVARQATGSRSRWWGPVKVNTQGIYLVALDGSAAHALTVCPDAGCVDLAPSFSPDGRWVAFTRARCDEPGSDCFVGDVWVVGVDGGRRPCAHARARSSTAVLRGDPSHREGRDTLAGCASSAGIPSSASSRSSWWACSPSWRSAPSRYGAPPITTGPATSSRPTPSSCWAPPSTTARPRRCSRAGWTTPR